MSFFENEDPSFGKEVGDRAGRVIFGCSDILEVAHIASLNAAVQRLFSETFSETFHFLNVYFRIFLHPDGSHENGAKECIV